MSGADEIISLIESKQNIGEFQELNWRGSFEDYLNEVIARPKVARTAFQRVYDMIMSHGVEEYTENKQKVIKYKFFDDIAGGGVDAIYGLEIPLMKLVSVFKSAARRYGTEKRILLLHGPVGSAKSPGSRTAWLWGPSCPTWDWKRPWAPPASNCGAPRWATNTSWRKCSVAALTWAASSRGTSSS